MTCPICEAFEAKRRNPMTAREAHETARYETSQRQDDYACGNPWAAPDAAEYAEAEAARQDATAPHEVPQCVADRAAERRTTDAKLDYAYWMARKVEQILFTQPR